MQRGFTLVELIVVIGILVLLTASVMPSISQAIAARELDNATRIMVSDLRWLQQISINGGGDGYVLNFRNAKPYGYNVVTVLDSQVIKAVTFPSRVELYGSPKPISFGINGAPAIGQSVTIGSTTTGKLKYIIIAATTGRVRISAVSVLE